MKIVKILPCIAAAVLFMGGMAQASAATNVKLTTLNSHSLNLSYDAATDVYTIETTGADPYLYTKALNGALPSEATTLSFEYKSNVAIGSLQIFYSYPPDPAKATVYRNVPAASEWTTYSIDITGERTKYSFGATAGARLRIDPGDNAGITMQVRHIRIHSAAETEWKPDTAFTGQTASLPLGDKYYQANVLDERTLADGVVHKVIRIPDYPLNIFLLDVDLTKKGNRVETWQASDRLGATELITSAATRLATSSKTPLAACNGSFWCVQAPYSKWEYGKPYGAVARNGEAYTSSDDFNGGYTRTGACAIDRNGRVHMGHFQWGAVLASSKYAIPKQISSHNRNQAGSGLALWTAAYGRNAAFQNNWTSDNNTTINNCDNYYLKLANGSNFSVNNDVKLVVGKIVKSADRQTLGDYDACVTAAGAYKNAMAVLAVGDTVTLNEGWTCVETGEKYEIDNMVEGNAMVLANGEPTERNTDEDYNNRQYPRTCLGTNEDGTHLYIFVTDQAQHPTYGLSYGCSTARVCQLLRALYPDVYSIISMDSGGSSQMLIGDAVVNKTYEKTNRALANGLMVFKVADTGIESIASDMPQGKAAALRISPNPATSVVTIDAGTGGRVSLYDTAGTLVMSQQVSGVTSLNVRGLATGMYLVQLSAGGKVATGKLIIK